MTEVPTPAASLRSHVHGGVDRAIWRLALPSIGGLAFTMLFNLVDLAFVGRLGPAAIAAISGSAFLIWGMQSLAEIPTIGGRARVANAAGADDVDRARHEVDASVALGFWLGLVALVGGLLSLGAIFDFMRVDDDVRAHGLGYLGILFAGVHGLVFLRVGEGLLQGSGDARTPMFAHMASLLANVILDPILIFGWGPFPRMEASGAALATVICQGGGALYCLAALRRRGLLDLDGARRALVGRTQGAVARIGLPVGGLSIIFCFVYVGLTRVVAKFGTAAIAALGIGHRVESIDYLIFVGFSSAAGALVGQNLGAGFVDRAHRTAVRTCLWASLSVIPMIVAMVAMPARIAALFVDDPQTVEFAASYIRAAGLSHVSMGWWIVLQGAFGGAGRTLGAMIVVLPAVVLRWPLAWWCAQRPELGIDAIWWTIAGTAALNGTLMALLWFRRTWAPPAEAC